MTATNKEELQERLFSLESERSMAIKRLQLRFSLLIALLITILLIIQGIMRVQILKGSTTIMIVGLVVFGQVAAYAVGTGRTTRLRAEIKKTKILLGLIADNANNNKNAS
jgi:uncharacterized integral membrane protein